MEGMRGGRQGGGGKFYRGDAMDEYLHRLGLVRKVNAKDETSLFRAVAEQVYLTQQHHAEIADIVHTQELEHDKTNNKMHNLLTTLATTLRHDVVIYRELGKCPYNVLGGSRFPQKVVLCESFGGCYDSVNTRAMHEKLGIAQSLVYEMLYEGVFGMSHELVIGAIRLIRNRPHHSDAADNKNRQQQQRYRSRSYATVRDGWSSEGGSSELESSNEHGGSGEMERPPFPFKVAKALDPAIYRNIEYDCWLEQRKTASIEMMLRERAMSAPTPFPPGLLQTMGEGSNGMMGGGGSYPSVFLDSPPLPPPPLPPSLYSPLLPPPLLAAPSPSLQCPPPPQLTLPFVVPTITVPYFDMHTVHYVNREVNPSSLVSGFDLPYNDVTTLRFFYNLGVQYARSASLHIAS